MTHGEVIRWLRDEAPFVRYDNPPAADLLGLVRVAIEEGWEAEVRDRLEPILEGMLARKLLSEKAGEAKP